eukprot:TRINITY_DN377_c0_g1_i7.p5 TRINITY_DN377_c0_g1~~TRINITY_DN377_c0_g1_i7.p5  ORF type:complete len:71 (-),score=10.09 TRINITY_DN377_c0_g1_i7:238-450(-)
MNRITQKPTLTLVTNKINKRVNGIFRRASNFFSTSKATMDVTTIKVPKSTLRQMFPKLSNFFIEEDPANL